MIYYFVNTIGGWLFQTRDPQDNPVGKWDGWKQITEEEYRLFVIVQGAVYPS